MFRRLLIPVDYSSIVTQNLEKMIEMAHLCRAEVVLFHVIEKIDHLDDVGDRRFYEKLHHKAEVFMNDVATRFREAGVVVEERLVYGKRLDEILQAVDATQADGVIMCSRRFSAEHPFMGPSSLGHTVAMLSQSSVILLK